MAECATPWSGFDAARHIDRERAAMQLEKLLKSADDGGLSTGAEHVRRLVSSEAWEARHGGLLAAKVLLSFSQDQEFKQDVLKLALTHLDDDEAHVRLAVAECLFVVAQKGDDGSFLAARDAVMQRIKDNFERDAAAPDEDVSGDVPKPSANLRVNPAQSGVRSMYRPHSWARKAELAATAGGWQRLKTSLKTVQRLFEGRAESASASQNPETPLTDARVQAAVRRAVKHGNRFIRETGFYILRAVLTGEMWEEAAEVAGILAAGLGDNWSQVRYAASVATRAFFNVSGAASEQLHSILLPPMCLNRHYIAEGVRIYSQETWKLAMGTKGREALATIATVTAGYFVQQCSSDNYAVREAACQCMGEMAVKVDPAAVAPHVDAMLTALCAATGDVNWPVREAACAASGQCVLTFPQEARASREQLLSTWLPLLRDSIASVRESAGVAVGRAATVYKEEVLPQILAELRTLLPQAKAEPSDAVRHGPDSGASPDVARDGSPSATCPNLDGEEECPQTQRTAKPWEASEGGIYLLRELSAAVPAKVPAFLPVLAELGHCTGFKQFPELLDTLYKQLPLIAQNVGKKTFKAYLELFLDPLFWALTCRQRLAESAAGYCVSELQQLVGPSIFRARLDDHQRAALDSSPFVGLPALQAQSAAINRTIIKSATLGNSGLRLGAPIMLDPRTGPSG